MADVNAQDDSASGAGRSEADDGHLQGARMGVSLLTALFDESDTVLFRPIETWKEGDRKKSHTHFKHTLYPKATPSTLGTSLLTHLRFAEQTPINIFYGVCPRFGGGGGYDLAWQIRTVRTLWTDIDDVTVEAALEKVAAAKLPPPSAIVSTGHGVHLYWVLDEPYPIDDVGDPPPVQIEFRDGARGKKKPVKYIEEDGERVYLDQRPLVAQLSPKALAIQGTLTGIAQAIGGDHTTDLARLLRIPGTMNRKNERNGKTPVPCILVECDSARRYPLATFDGFQGKSEDAKRAERAALMPLPRPRKLTASRGDKLSQLIAASGIAESGQRSEADFAVCCFALRAGVPKEELWPQVAGVGKFAERGEAYFNVTWQNAEHAVRVGLLEKLQPEKRSPPSKAANDEPDSPTAASNGASAGRGDGGEPPRIVIDTDEDRVNQEALSAVAMRPDVFTAGGELVQLISPDGEPARIAPIEKGWLRDRMAAAAQWVVEKTTEEGEVFECDAHPPGWAVDALLKRGNYPGLRPLRGVVEHPVLRPDGTLAADAGYDAVTGLYLAFDRAVSVPENPSQADACSAAAQLLDLVGDVPLVNDAHRAAWLAGLLTPLCRPAFAGLAPGFLVEANARGAGKGLLVNVIMAILTGRTLEATAYAEEEELRKKLTAAVRQGRRHLVFDNLTGRFGGGTLDAFLTAEHWRDRILGVSQDGSWPNQLTMYATGNNVAVNEDTCRRLCFIKIETPHEKPEDRTDFKRPKLLAYVRANRSTLLSAALTIVAAYVRAGRPDLAMKPWGSFEAWSELVRGALLFAGCADAGETRTELQNKDGSDVAVAKLFAEYLAAMTDQGDLPKTARDILNASQGDEVTFGGVAGKEMLAALESTMKEVNSKSVGYLLRKYEGRVLGGYTIRRSTGRGRAGFTWFAAESKAAETSTPSAPSPHLHPSTRASAQPQLHVPQRVHANGVDGALKIRLTREGSEKPALHTCVCNVGAAETSTPSTYLHTAATAASSLLGYKEGEPL